jgi:AraC-like DNA-binding protein
MELTFLRPSRSLAPFIDRYWMYEGGNEADSFRPLATPGVGLDLFIHFDIPFKLAGGEQFPLSHILFSGQRSAFLWSPQKVWFIAIRFRAGALKNFTSIPLAELLDTYADAEGLWGKDGGNMVKTIRTRATGAELIGQLDLFLQRQLILHRKDAPVWNTAIETLYRNSGNGEIDEIARGLGITARHFRRRFIVETGFSPKHFQRLARFHATIKPLLLGKETNYLPEALGNGYFDQTHFIREFRSFTQLTPGNFLRKKEAMSHFYYPSLRS